MKILFIGKVELSLCMLKILLEKHAEIVGVVTSKDQGINSDFADLGPTCKEYEVPVLFDNDVNSTGTVEWIRKLSPDVIFCIGWSKLLKSEVLQLAPMGVVGYHPSALPENRGRHPLIWALVLGLKSTASTFFFMDDEADSGDILDQRVIPISQEDDAATLYAKMIEVANKQIVDLLPLLISDQFKRVPQDCSIANVWRKRGERDGVIDWRMSANSIHNLVRGLTRPYIGAHISIGDQIHRVWKSRKLSCENLGNVEPGRVLEVTDEGTVMVKCGEGKIELLSVEPPLKIRKGECL